MAKHREPDWEPYLRRSRRRTAAEALRAAGRLPENPITPAMYAHAIAQVAAHLGLPVEVVRAHIDKLAEK
jgi:hypothetical protein